jgi:hypothetical protein
LWLDGDLPEKLRPDKCGCIVWLNGRFDYAGETINLYGVEQSYDAAWLGHKVKPLLDALVGRGFVFTIIQNHSIRLMYSKDVYPLLDVAAVFAKVESDMDVEKLKADGALPGDMPPVTYGEALEFFRGAITNKT